MNQDAFLDRSDIGLWVVADGAGGHGTGEIASSRVVAALADLPASLSGAELLAQIRLRVGAVHKDLQAGLAGPVGIGPTASTVVILLARAGHFACLWAGDSRAYLLRQGVLMQLTRDHSVVQELIDEGRIAAHEASTHPYSHVITRAVGNEGPLELEKVFGPIQDGDRWLLCSDGLYNSVTADVLERLASDGADGDAFVSTSLEAGAKDNVTAVVVSLNDAPAAEAPSVPPS